jgi:hypothetical protein
MRPLPPKATHLIRPLFHYRRSGSYRLYRKRPPHIVNRTVPKIIVISVHTVNRFPLIYASWIYSYLCNQCLSPLTLTVSYKTYRNTYQISQCVSLVEKVYRYTPKHRPRHSPCTVIYNSVPARN